ncbi:COX15/CtaA family protein [Algoriphagus sediminis]|uniref:COX15/CtaA family protein n=1 Tax=Algoriphagus sediminis TaxID=3057113 RepID=A0ABT7YGU9_9BACT|nr:COX15/CtaA family protein [Algoriphagus sediminis]MDN3205693.1 COX15/CtaA family protein [Algoriphagus sediminis]
MNQNLNKKLISFRRVSLYTVIAVFFLIWVGGLVRSTGSGMGCPDWPKCFGQVVPPTNVDQLPDNYQEIYLEKRLAKNERFVATLKSLGLSDTADQIANDKSILVEEEFNATKTWIEYVNRLIGVVIGLLIILTVWKSFPMWKVDKRITIGAIASLILVLFQGWIGSLVVSTNLIPWMITFHMILALLLAGLLIWIFHLANRRMGRESVKMDVPRKVEWLLILGIILMLIQIVLGTQVREQIDSVATSLGYMLRDTWVEKSGRIFLVHRSFSLSIFGVHLVYFIMAFKYTLRNSQINFWSQVLMAFIIVEIATGMGMAYFGIPAFLQPFHLVIGCMITGVQVLLYLQLRDTKQFSLK